MAAKSLPLARPSQSVLLVSACQTHRDNDKVARATPKHTPHPHVVTRLRNIRQTCRFTLADLRLVLIFGKGQE
eukprot:40133-Prorocentrum_lima.AAC.1